MVTQARAMPLAMVPVPMTPIVCTVVMGLTLAPAACPVVSETSAFGRNSARLPWHHRFVAPQRSGRSARRRRIIATFRLRLVRAQRIACVVSFGLGLAILMCGDKVVRPIVARGGVRLPFAWVLMGCLGGFEVLGLVGLVVGPVVLTSRDADRSERRQLPQDPRSVAAGAARGADPHHRSARRPDRRTQQRQHESDRLELILQVREAGGASVAQMRPNADGSLTTSGPALASMLPGIVDSACAAVA